MLYYFSQFFSIYLFLMKNLFLDDDNDDDDNDDDNEFCFL